jgi:Trypsin-like peptidase domain
MLRSLLFVLLSVTAAVAAQAQEREAVVHVITDVGSSILTGRGVVVSPELVVTAEHVVKHQEQYYLPLVRFSNGAEVRASELKLRWPDRDMLLLKVRVPSDIPSIAIDPEEPTEAWSFDLQFQKRQYKWCIANQGSNYFDYTPQSGESGGPVFSKRGLVGVVSGGWFWLEGRKNCTWPLRAGRTDVLKEYVQEKVSQ